MDQLDDEYPLRLTTGRRLESYNTGVQTGGYDRRSTAAARRSCSRLPTAERYGVADGTRARIVSRRGAVEAPVRYDPTLRPGLVFMTLHFPDDVATNVLTIDVTDPKSGTAEFKATAIRVEASSVDIRLPAAEPTDDEREAIDAIAGPPPETRASASRTATGTAAICCCRRCARCSAASAGSARARSTTCAAASTCRPPTRTASRRSTR